MLTPPKAMRLISAAEARRGRAAASMRGQTLLEFALVVPVFLLLVCAVVDFGHVMYMQMTVQHAVQEAGRFAVTGTCSPDPNNASSNLSRVNSIIQMAKQQAPGVDFTSISISSAQGGSGNPGGPLDIVTISFSTNVSLITPMIGKFFTNSVYPLTVGVTFMNEPFPLSTPNCKAT